MSLDIGIDFTRNDGPPREVVLTDWEARLVEHCVGLYLEAAITLDDVTAPLARTVLAKIAVARMPANLTPTQRRNARRRETRRLRRAIEDLATRSAAS